MRPAILSDWGRDHTVFREIIVRMPDQLVLNLSTLLHGGDFGRTDSAGGDCMYGRLTDQAAFCR